MFNSHIPHSEHHHAKTIAELAEELQIPHLPQLVCALLHMKIHSDNNQPCSTCPFFVGNIFIFNSAFATFYTPSDLCGKEGMHQEYIQACLNWRNEGSCQDYVFVVTNPDGMGFQEMDIACILCFFLFSFQGSLYPCAIICWFDHISDAPNNDTGMWIVKPSVTAGRLPKFMAIHINSIFYAAHLIPVFTVAPQLPSQGIHPHHLGSRSGPHSLSLFATSVRICCACPHHLTISHSMNSLTSMPLQWPSGHVVVFPTTICYEDHSAVPFPTSLHA